MQKKVWALVTIITLVMTGCGGDDAVKPDVDDRTGAQTSGGGAGADVKGEQLGDMLSQRVIYFDFDSASISSESAAIVEAHAKHLAANKGATVTLEGHCDERGTREYNLALGERRAESVARMMRLLGLSSDRVKTVSYGEEKPADSGHDESAWGQNRRVEIKY